MQQIGIWHVRDQGLLRLKLSAIDFEKDLEDWIEQNPELLEQGLEIVGRQLYVEGGYLDLLGINPQGQWVVIELKSGSTDRGALTQSLDYASCIATMPWEDLSQVLDTYLHEHERSIEDLVEAHSLLDGDTAEVRDVVIYVVGTGSSSRFDRIVDYLSGTYEVPITLVSYDVFQIGEGHKILVRELTEPETSLSVKPKTRSVEAIAVRAAENGIGREFQLILDAAKRHNLYLHPYKVSIMVTPPDNHARMLFTVRNWTRSDGLLKLYFGAAAFSEFYPVTEEEVHSIFGEDGWRPMTLEDVERFVANLDHLFEDVIVLENNE